MKTHEFLHSDHAIYEDISDEEEEHDTLGELPQRTHAGTLLLGSAETPPNLPKTQHNSVKSGVSSLTGTFFSAKTSQSATSFGKLDVSSFGTSHFSTSPLAEAMGREISFTTRLRENEAARRPMSLGSSSDYTQMLEQKGLLASIDTELNWSGRPPGSGQHVEFDPYETIPLEDVGTIFHSATAKIDKVRCRRIHLASMVCYRKLKISEAMNEVEHLHKLRHAHIVQLVGTYVQGKTFALLLYPVAELDLKDFLSRIERVLVPGLPMEYGHYMAVASVGQFYSCLAAALAYVHEKTTKHLDIKPRNILVKRNRDCAFGYQVYLADFGISRSFSPLGHSQTESTVGRTARYCAPEVFADKPHGRAADIFSLGCVYLEMQAVLCRKSLGDLDDVLMSEIPTLAFHSNLEPVFGWIKTLSKARPAFVMPIEDILQREVFAKHLFDDGEYTSENTMSGRHASVCAMIRDMLNEIPGLRPTAANLVTLFDKKECCDKGREAFRSAPANSGDRIDSSNELNRLFSPSIQNSTLESERILVSVVETGEIPLTETILRYFAAYHRTISNHTIRELLATAFINEDLDLLKSLTSHPSFANFLPQVLSKNITYLDDQKLAKLLFDHPDIRNTSKDTVPLLMAATAQENLELVQAMLSHGFSVDCKLKDGTTLLRIAVFTGNCDLVDMFLKNKAPIENCGLSIAIAAGCSALIEPLRAAGANVLARETCPWPEYIRSEHLRIALRDWPAEGQNALVAAVKAKKYGLVSELLDHVPCAEAHKAIDEDRFLAKHIGLPDAPKHCTLACKKKDILVKDDDTIIER